MGPAASRTGRYDHLLAREPLVGVLRFKAVAVKAVKGPRKIVLDLLEGQASGRTCPPVPGTAMAKGSGMSPVVSGAPPWRVLGLHGHASKI